MCTSVFMNYKEFKELLFFKNGLYLQYKNRYLKNIS